MSPASINQPTKIYTKNMQKAIDRTKINVKNQKKFKGKLILVATRKRIA